jgi:hypothetical protein
MKKAAEKLRPNDQRDPWGGLGVRLAVGGAVAFGALASGFLVSRRGRRLVADTFRGTQRTPVADRVLDLFWDEPVLARRRLDVEEPSEGVLLVTGAVASDRERALALALAASAPGVSDVHDLLVVDPSLVRRRARSGKDL